MNGTDGWTNDLQLAASRVVYVVVVEVVAAAEDEDQGTPGIVVII